MLDSHKAFLSSLFLFEDDAKIFDDDFTKDVMEKSQESRLDKGTVSTPYGTARSQSTVRTTIPM